MPARTRNADFIDAIEETGVLTDDQIRELRSTDKRIYTGVLAIERRRRQIEAKYGECALDMMCRSGSRHDLEGIEDDDLAELIPEVRGLSIKEVRVCVRCSAHVVETRDSAGRRDRAPIYVCTPLYEAIKEAFTCAEAAALARIDRWENRLGVIAKKCKVSRQLIKGEEKRRAHIRLAQTA